VKPKLRRRLFLDLTYQGKVYRGLRLSAIERLEQSGDPEAFAVLAQVFVSTEHDWTRDQIRQALERMRDDQAAVDVMAATMMSTGAVELATVIADRTPSDPLRHAVALYIAGKFDRYEDLDFDGSLLRTARRTGSLALRQALAQVSRDSGRLPWARTVAEERRAHDGRLSDAEWAAAVAALVRTERWDELVDLATRAPVTVGADILGELGTRNRRPSDRDGRGKFARLTKLAAAARRTGPPEDGRFGDAALQVLDGGMDVNALAVSPDGSLLASSGFGEPVRLWNLVDVRAFPSLIEWARGVKCLAYTPDGQQLLAGGRGGRIARWSLSQERPLDPLVGHRRKVVAFAVAPDGKTLFSSGTGSEIRMWELPSGRPKAVIEGDRLWTLDLALSPDGTQLFSSGSSQVRVHRLPDGTVDAELQSHRSTVTSLALAPDGELMATGSMDKTVRLWHLPTGRSTACLDDHRAAVDAVAMTPDGKWLASAGADGSVRVWELPSGRAAYVLGERLGRAQCLAMSPDGSLLACGTAKGLIHLWRRRLSPLHALLREPLDRIGPDELDELEGWDSDMTDDERVWKDLILGLVHWRGRHDVELGNAEADPATRWGEVELGD
jgi:sugar lactone lactonase YvrE